MRAFDTLSLGLCFALASALGGCSGDAASVPDLDATEPANTPAAGGSGQDDGDDHALSGASSVAIGAPQPVAPATGAVVTSNPPKLSWRLAPGTTGALIQICSDRECKHVEHRVVARGTTGKPPVALMPGVHYYRLLGVVARTSGVVASPSIPFTVRHRTSPVESSWGSTPDYDGDGYADLAITSRHASSAPGGAAVDSPRVAIHSGSAAGLAPGASKLIDIAPGVTPDAMHWVANAGDLDGDGFSDLLVGVPGGGRVEVHMGSATGLAAAAATTLTSPTKSEGFAVRGAALGDVNGDGFADFAIEEANGSRLFVFHGRAGALATAPDATILPPAESSFGAVAAAGDVNGDGYADVLVARTGTVGRVDVFTGGPKGLSAQPLVTLASASSDTAAVSSFGRSVIGAGDLDGDGYADIAVAASTSSYSSPWQVYVYFGTALGPKAPSSLTLAAPASAGDRGPELASAGDVDGDGFDDLLVGSPETLAGGPTLRTLLVRAVLYYGSPFGPTSEGAQSFTLPSLVSDYEGTFGRSLGSAGDFNRDGYGDVVLGVAQRATPGLPGVSSTTTKSFVYVHRGSPTGATSSPATTLESEPSDAAFGMSLARSY